MTNRTKWKSPTLGEQREMMIVGTEGTPVLVFPSRRDAVDEWLHHGMFDALKEQVEEGYNQFFCLSGLMDSQLEEGGDDNRLKATGPELWRQDRYLDYVHDEVFPYVQKQNSNEYWIAAGVGEGAYLAAMAAWKNPDRIKKVILINGIFQYGGAVDPVSTIETMNVPAESDPFEQLDIRILTFENAVDRQQSHRLSDALWARSREHQFYVWDLHAENRWDLAGRMMREHIF